MKRMVLAVCLLVGGAAFAGETGRYQVVNPTPDRAMHIMLVDTQTGQTWMICMVEGESQWCPMRKSTAPGVDKARVSTWLPKTEVPPEDAAQAVRLKEMDRLTK